MMLRGWGFVGLAAAGTAIGCRPEPPPDAVDDPLGPTAIHDATFALTSIGPRQVATPEEETARAWVEAQLTEAGLADVVSEPFVFDAWRPGTASVQMDREVPVEALSPTGPTDVTLVLRDPSTAFDGAALLLSSDEGSRADAYFTAVGGGAAALIRVTEDIDVDGAPLVEVGHLVDGTHLPAVAVDHGTGLWLADRLGQEVHLRVTPDIAADHTSSNVVGRIHGTDGGAGGKVYVVGHYDSWHPSESAFDNALGAGALVALARRAAAAPAPERDVVFLATSGEEQGLKGALAWVAAHADSDAIGVGDLVIVLDVVWSAEGDYLALATDDGLHAEAIDAAAAEGLDATDGGDPGLGSDHVPFVSRGASAVWLGRWPDRHYHTLRDTIDQLDFDEASAAVRTNWRILAAHAGFEP